MQRYLISGFLCVATVSSAQPAGAQAEVLFRQGRELLDSGRIAEACTMFAKSQDLQPELTTLVNLAGCREQQGEIATAWGHFLDAERQSRNATDPASQQLHQVASDHAAKLEPRVSKLAIRVSDGEPRDLEVARDGDVIDRALWNRALPIDGGAYTITVRAKGYAGWTTRIDVASERANATVDVPMLAPLTEEAPSIPSPSIAHRSRLPAYVVGGGALALLGGGLGTELWARSTYRAAEHELIDQARRDSLERSANHQRYAAEALVAAGIATAGIAVVLWLHGGKEATAAESVAQRIVVSPSGFAFAGQF